ADPTEYASLPKTPDNEARQFLLVTHSRVQSRRTNLDLLNTFNGRRRDLVFWDESLLAAHGHGISKREIESALAWLETWVTKEDGALNNALVYFRECAVRLNWELDGQKQRRRGARLIQLPELSTFEADLYSRALRKRSETKPLASLLDLRERYLRVIPVNQGGGAVVTYDITVPNALKDVILLDASYPIRQLERLDPTILPAPSFSGAVKRY